MTPLGGEERSPSFLVVVAWEVVGCVAHEPFVLCKRPWSFGVEGNGNRGPARLLHLRWGLPP